MLGLKTFNDATLVTKLI